MEKPRPSKSNYTQIDYHIKKVSKCVYHMYFIIFRQYAIVKIQRNKVTVQNHILHSHK